MYKIELDNKKYTILYSPGYEEEFTLKVLRFGEEWRNLIGDKLFLAMAERILELEDEVKALKDVIDIT